MKEHNLKLLLVDDDKVFGKVLSRYAKKKNIDVTVCHSAGEFLVETCKSDFDVIVMDCFLGVGVYGHDLVAHCEHVPLVFTSGTKGWRHEQVESGHDVLGFVHKKYGASAILDKALFASR